MPNDDLDLKDSRRDEERMQPEETTINLPDVEDIPGQENITPPKMSEFVDTTASSADEEGESVFAEDELNADTDVTEEEKDLLQRSSESMASDDDEDRRKVMLDNTDDDGEALNVKTEASGVDLDVPGAEADDENEAIGEEDEENNHYSLGRQ